MDLKSTAVVVLDSSFLDTKQRTLLSEPTVKNDLRDLLQKHIFPLCRSGELKLAMF